ncbi:helix-turn-helix transcriptional regulator [Microbacterium sp. Bi128]|uniref:helix-turn-helix transcriptional regulator n=1 Tax=Microbacterium sp. Bi128 TaxID=2821115 RepID=UPI001D36C400|nr:helix-turn-helix transcriptional regulator [Microbacterium sp. Bi128]CAH0178711.1 hypothetical protein SRABI128_01215 [Microbacterium sp. Bi128]
MVVSGAPDPWADYSRLLGANLQRARLGLALTQERVAHAAGLSTFTYQKLEKGESNPGTAANPRLQTLISLALVLEVDVSDLLPPPTTDLLPRTQ